MPVNKYNVYLTEAERLELNNLISKGKASAKMIMHAHVLLATDACSDHKMSERRIAETFRISAQTVHNIRKMYSEEGLATALGRKKRGTPPILPKITGDIEARIIAICCGEPPKGRAKWSVRLIADKVVELHILDDISHESVHRVLKKTSSNRT